MGDISAELSYKLTWAEMFSRGEGDPTIFEAKNPSAIRHVSDDPRDSSHLVQRLSDPLGPTHKDQFARNLLLIFQHVPDPLFELDLELIVGLGFDVLLSFKRALVLFHLERSKGDGRGEQIDVQVDTPARRARSAWFTNRSRRTRTILLLSAGFRQCRQ